MIFDRTISIATIIFVIFLLMFFLVVPEYNMFLQLRAEFGQKTAEFKAQSEYYTQVDKVYAELQGRKEDIKKIEDALPQESDFGKLVYSLQKFAKENGLIVQNLSLSKSLSNNIDTSVAGNTKEITFSLSLMGQYSSLEGFILSLEKSSRIFEIISISFGSAGPNSALKVGSLQPQAQQTQSFNLQIKTHSY